MKGFFRFGLFTALIEMKQLIGTDDTPPLVKIEFYDKIAVFKNKGHISNTVTEFNFSHFEEDSNNGIN